MTGEGVAWTSGLRLSGVGKGSGSSTSDVLPGAGLAASRGALKPPVAPSYMGADPSGWSALKPSSGASSSVCISSSSGHSTFMRLSWMPQNGAPRSA